jgi:hypothetical protein
MKNNILTGTLLSIALVSSLNASTTDKFAQSISKLIDKNKSHTLNITNLNNKTEKTNLELEKTNADIKAFKEKEHSHHMLHVSDLNNTNMELKKLGNVDVATTKNVNMNKEAISVLMEKTSNKDNELSTKIDNESKEILKVHTELEVLKSNITNLNKVDESTSKDLLSLRKTLQTINYEQTAIKVKELTDLINLIKQEESKKDLVLTQSLEKLNLLVTNISERVVKIEKELERKPVNINVIDSSEFDKTIDAFLEEE